MKIYICLPQKLYTTENVNLLPKVLKEKLDSSTINPEIMIIGKKESAALTIYIMGPLKKGIDENQFEKEIKELISAKINVELVNNIAIKIHYDLFNPSFAPISNIEINQASEKQNSIDEFDYEKLSKIYLAQDPRYSFDQVILPESVKKEITEAIGILQVQHKVFEEWGLKNIIPDTTAALSFFGQPGTGKSMAAEAIANELGKKILKATYADIESKYHGEGPKMVKAIFKAAEDQDAVLFIDEADSLLSKRLTNVTDGSAQAINSMRSQLLISLEHYNGIVIFATNLVINYDKAFLSRLISIEFPLPQKESRIQIWETHLKHKGVNIPLADDVNIEYLADKYEFCGREIKNAVKKACISAALQNMSIVNQKHFVDACETLLKEKDKINSAKELN